MKIFNSSYGYKIILLLSVTLNFNAYAVLPDIKIEENNTNTVKTLSNISLLSNSSQEITSSVSLQPSFVAEVNWDNEKDTKLINFSSESDSYNVIIKNLDFYKNGIIKLTKNQKDVACLISNKKNVEIEVFDPKCNFILGSANIFSLGDHEKEFQFKSPGDLQILHPLKGKKINIQGKKIQFEKEIEPQESLDIKFKYLIQKKPYLHPCSFESCGDNYTNLSSQPHKPSKIPSYKIFLKEAVSLV